MVAGNAASAADQQMELVAKHRKGCAWDIASVFMAREAKKEEHRRKRQGKIVQRFLVHVAMYDSSFVYPLWTVFCLLRKYVIFDIFCSLRFRPLAAGASLVEKMRYGLLI